jgi:hypothetical protein
VGAVRNPPYPLCASRRHWRAPRAHVTRRGKTVASNLGPRKPAHRPRNAEPVAARKKGTCSNPKETITMRTPTDCLENPEDWLWLRRPDGTSTVIGVHRLYELRAGAAPETPREELLAGNPEWLRIYLAHCLGIWPIPIPANGLLPDWDAGWLRAVGETDEEREVGPKWLLK